MCAASPRKALPQLAAELGLELPPAQAGPPCCGWRPSADAVCRRAEFVGSLEQLGAARLRAVQKAAERRLCARLPAAEHALGLLIVIAWNSR